MAFIDPQLNVRRCSESCEIIELLEVFNEFEEPARRVMERQKKESPEVKIKG